MLGFLLVLVTAAQASPCAQATLPDQLSAALETAEAAFEGSDREAFTAATRTAATTLTCLDAPLTPTLAARYHRVHALDAFLQQDPQGATLSFAAARSIEPAWILPETLAPAGHPLQQAYTSAAVLPATSAPVPPPAEGQVLFDGRPLDQRPTTWPTILQMVRADGSVAATTWLAPSAPLPEWPIRTTPTPRETSEHSGRGLVWASAASLLLAGGLYGGAGVVERTYDNENEADVLEVLYQWNHGLVIGSGGAAALGLGLGAGAFLVGRW